MATNKFVRGRKWSRRSRRSLDESDPLIEEAFARLEKYVRPGATQERNGQSPHAAQGIVVELHGPERDPYEPCAALREFDRIRAAARQQSCDQDGKDKQRNPILEVLLDDMDPITREVYFASRAGCGSDEIATRFGISQHEVQRHIARAVLYLMNCREPV